MIFGFLQHPSSVWRFFFFIRSPCVCACRCRYTHRSFSLLLLQTHTLYGCHLLHTPASDWNTHPFVCLLTLLLSPLLGLMSSLFPSDKSFLYGSQDSVRNAKHKPPVPVLLSRNRACFVGWLNSPHANLSSILKTDVWFSHAASSEQLAWVSASHAG